MLTSVLKHVYVERKKRWWKDRGKKKTRRTNPLPGDTSSFCLTVWSFVNFTL